MVINMKIKIIFLLSFLLVMFLPGLAFGLPAFPSAEGYGRDTTGARGGSNPIVCKVVNLTDSASPGTGVDTDATDGIASGNLRYCLDPSGVEAATGPGASEVDGVYIVFPISGIINLDYGGASGISISNAKVTIAGQTSPGGILVAGEQIRVRSGSFIMTHMRIRPGNHNSSGNVHGFMAYTSNGATLEFIIDHNSLSWGQDEVFSLSADGTTDIINGTASWNIIAEGLDDENHGHSALLSAKTNGSTGPCNDNINISFHHNFLAHGRDRHPAIGFCQDDAWAEGSYVSADVVNNVVYNPWHGFKPSISKLSTVNYVDNYYKGGPNGYDGDDGYNCEFSIILPSGSPVRMLYMEGNIGSYRDAPEDPEWAVCNSYNATLVPDTWQSSTEFSFPNPITSTTMTSIYADTIVANVGATVPVRDSVDTNIAADYTNSTGSMLESLTYPDDWPTFSTSGDNPTDTDGDGMPDSYETILGFNPAVADATDDDDSDGYHNIEEYFHYLAGDTPVQSSSAGIPIIDSTGF